MSTRLTFEPGTRIVFIPPAPDPKIVTGFLVGSDGGFVILDFRAITDTKGYGSKDGQEDEAIGLFEDLWSIMEQK